MVAFIHPFVRQPGPPTAAALVQRREEHDPHGSEGNTQAASLLVQEQLRAKKVLVAAVARGVARGVARVRGVHCCGD